MGKTMVRIEGLAELRKSVEKLTEGMRRRVYRGAVKAAGKVVTDAAKERVPRRTGTLAASVVARASSKPALGLFGVKVTVRGGKDASGRVAHRKGNQGKAYKPDAVERYYRFQETGTKHHAAQPFLKPALEGSAGQVLEVLKRELGAGIEREAAKARS